MTVKEAPGKGLFVQSDGDLRLNAYCDADWGGYLQTRHFTTGYFVRLGDSPIFWRTKKLQVVARYSAETEYREMTVIVSEVIWLRWLLRELGVSTPSATPLP
ncbi:unnamed protein product [Linum trigynum]|uniref:Mitochondrial protein n=1 Tax=Linum trigynum TaxID=586398 RepID=A0AAV2GL02_9ROSI